WETHSVRLSILPGSFTCELRPIYPSSVFPSPSLTFTSSTDTGASLNSVCIHCSYGGCGSDISKGITQMSCSSGGRAHGQSEAIQTISR
ncbi:hypothetical protein PMAYCL1PPCAC_15137, partial [Pristionchus mayeri]